MKSIELFSGIGGIALAAEWAGIETVAFCERDPFCQKVLNKHWPDIPIFDDVYTLNRKVLEQQGVIEPNGTIDIISGGFPCQPFSIAGSKKEEKMTVISGQKCLESYKSYSRLGLLVRMLLTSPIWSSNERLLTWKVKDTKLKRLLFRLAVSMPNTKETGFSLWPTPTQDTSLRTKRYAQGGLPLGMAVQLYATPTASQNHKPIRPLAPSEANGKHGKVLPGCLGEKHPEHIGKQINPQFVEWLMGFPEDWTKVG
jgi:hypothetical protein